MANVTNNWNLIVRIWIMYEREVQGRETVTYRLEIPQCNYLPIVELEEEVVFRPELKEELRQRLSGWVGLGGDQNWMEAGGDLKSQ